MEWSPLDWTVHMESILDFSTVKFYRSGLDSSGLPLDQRKLHHAGQDLLIVPHQRRRQQTLAVELAFTQMQPHPVREAGDRGVEADVVVHVVRTRLEHVGYSSFGELRGQGVLLRGEVGIELRLDGRGGHAWVEDAHVRAEWQPFREKPLRCIGAPGTGWR